MDVNPRIAGGVDVDLPAVDGQIGGPSQVDDTAAVVLVGVEDAVVVAIVAVE